MKGEVETQFLLFGLLLHTQPLHSSEQHRRAHLGFSSHFGWYRLIFFGNLTLICYLPGQVGEQIPHFLSIYFPFLSTFVEHQLPPASSSLTQLLCFTPDQIKGKTHGWSGSGLSLLVCPLLLFRRVRQFASVPVNILFHFSSVSVSSTSKLACLFKIEFIQNLWF